MPDTAYAEFEIRGDECLRGLSRAFGCRPGLSEEDSLTVGAMVTCIVPVTGGKDGLVGTGVFAYPHMEPKELEKHASRLAGALGYELTNMKSGTVNLEKLTEIASRVLRESEKHGKVGVPYLSRAYMTVQAGDVPILFLRGDELDSRARNGLAKRVKGYEDSVVVATLPKDIVKETSVVKDEPVKERVVPAAVILVPHEKDRGGRER